METGQPNVGVTHCQAEAETGDSAAGAAPASAVAYD